MPKIDRTQRWFLAAVAFCGMAYAGFGWSPSSYGVVLETLGAPEGGPIAGASRDIRGDEWSVATPYLQAAVRNRFLRFNETSFYHEDLRNFYALPLKDWGLAFKPQFWAFFVLAPARAYSIYHALWMVAFLAGYQLLFRRLGMSSWLAAAGSVMVFFSGYSQFWWTTYGPSLAGFAWILLVVLQPMRWWVKALICSWVFPAWVFALVYPTLLLTLAWGGLIVILAVRPSFFRSYRDLGAVATGALAGGALLYLYYADVIPIMRNTVYPGQRIAPAGTAHVVAAASQLFPFIGYSLSDYRTLIGANICETSALGSFLPLMTLCLMRFRDAWNRAATRTTLLILLAGFTAITVWELAPVPGWIGRMLLWNTGPAARWLFTSGLLLTVASLLLWRDKLISVHPLRIILFVFVGPIASLLLKLALLTHRGGSDGVGMAEMSDDIILCGLLLAAGLASCYVPAAARAPLLLIGITLGNVYGFGRFNPLQPAEPIFRIPETKVVHELRKEEAASPGGVLADPQSLASAHFGSALNGLGFRSVDHVLLAPKLSFFRKYFRAMDPVKFNFIFNRYGYIHASREPMPYCLYVDSIEVPVDVFIPARNVRVARLGPPRRDTCSQAPQGGVDSINSGGERLTIEGWAPWVGETDQQGILVLSARPLQLEISTIERPDIAERMSDYRLVKSGFKLRVAASDGKLLSKELVLVAFGTASGEQRLACCGCPFQ